LMQRHLLLLHFKRSLNSHFDLDETCVPSQGVALISNVLKN